MHNEKFFIIFILLLNYQNEIFATPASAHLHQKDLNHEREEDGSFMPRNSHHTDKDGKHSSEFDHEVILGSVKDAEEFDTLPVEESKKRLRILVKQMDLDNDKSIDRNELKAWIIRSFKLLSKEEADDHFDDLDENDDQKISWEEYLKDTFGIETINDETDDKLISDDKELFYAADENHDGFLDKNEFVVFNRPEEDPKMLPILLKHSLRDKDTNSDGFIDFQEFIGNRGETLDKEAILSEKDTFDNDYDKDQDGRLNSAEILSWLVPSNEEIAEEEVVHLFAASDDDHDNLLSYDEIVEHYDIFVGSEATDYGDQLQKLPTHFEDEL